jgi:eukaryotic-like serine/threonine-protein kinase
MSGQVRGDEETSPAGPYGPLEASAPASDDPRLARWLSGLQARYDVVERHSSSNASWVFRGTDRRSAKSVAIKLLKDWKGASRDAFIAEALLLAELKHPGIVRYIGHGELPEGGAYLVTEWLMGVGLDGLLRRGPLSTAESLTVLARTANVLAAAHARGVVHLDLKPSNLFLVDSDSANVRLLDFGLARLTRSVRYDRDDRCIAGTPGYMAPEQVLGERISPATDVFALGCVLFRCLVGQPIFTGDGFAVMSRTVAETAPSPRSAGVDVHPAVDALAASMLAAEASRRPPDASAVLAAVAALPDAVFEGIAPSARALVKPGGVTAAERVPVTVILLRLGPEADDLPERADPEWRPAAGFERLTDGTWLALPRGNASALDQALHGARLALDLRARWPASGVAIAARRGVDGARRGDLHELVVDAEELLRRAAPGQIVVDEDCAALVRARCALDRTEGEPARLVGLARSADRRGGVEGPSVCLGRADQVARIVDIARDAFATPRARAVVVLGPAGIGKSHVVRAVIDRLGSESVPPASWTSYGDSMSVHSTLQLVARMLSGASAAVAPGLAKVLETQRAAADTERVGEAGSVDEVHRLLGDAVSGQLVRGPLVLQLEDIHWADLASLRAIDYLLARLAQRPLLVLATARPELRELFPDLWQKRPLDEIRLDELGEDDSDRLICEELGAEVPAGVRARIIEHARGNPFLLIELIRARAEGLGDKTPATVLGVVQSRLRAFDPDARRLLRAASILGESFRLADLRQVLGAESNAIDIEQWLDLLVARATLRRIGDEGGPQSTFVFAHALIRDAAYDLLTESDRKLGHRLAAEWLEGAGQGPRVVTAQHYERADDAAGAGRSYHLATVDAFKMGDLRSAVRCAELALSFELPKQARGHTQAVAADAHRLMGNVEEARRLSAEALRELSPNTPLWRQAARTAMMAGASTARHGES